MGIALICAFCATPFQAAAVQEIVIQHYTHRGCVTGNGELLLPIYALQGDVARVREGNHWDCERVINSATLSCEQAVEAPYSMQNEHPECLAVFAAEVRQCLAHYNTERRKCASGSAASTGMVGVDASERRRVQEALATAGFDPGPTDGVFGPKTRRAIQAWQHANGYAMTGKLTSRQVEVLLGGTGTLEPIGPNWTITENQPCQVYNFAPQPVETVTWSGGCMDGKASGEGRKVWRGSYGEAVYEGTMREGKDHGIGTHIWPNGERYEGEWRDGKRTGYGTHTWTDGNRYEGEFRDGKKHGYGTHTWAGGSRYEGQYRDGKKHGYGTYTWADGSRYEGQYRGGKPNGFGALTRIDGMHYQGQWRDGCSGRDGQYLMWIDTTQAACGF